MSGIREIKSRTVITKAALNKKKKLFTSKLNLNLRKKLAFYGTANGTLR